MLAIRVVDRLSADDRLAVGQLLERATEADDHPALSDDHLIALDQGAAGSGAGFAGLLATNRGTLVGYAQALANGETWSVATAVHPGARSPDLRVAEGLVEAAVAEIGRQGGGLVRLWAYQAGTQEATTAERLGFQAERTLYQMRRPLPVDEPVSLNTRPFRPGVDEEAWIAVNNRAFAWHPEQSGWTLPELQAHEAEPWFDPDGFLLHEIDGRLAGFCWTKIHQNTRPRLGEIYVIAADPDFAGRGLGRQLVLAGLAYLAGRGITVATLYTEADNKAAVRLYVNLDFIVDHLDRSFTLQVPAGP